MDFTNGFLEKKESNSFLISAILKPHPKFIRSFLEGDKEKLKSLKLIFKNVDFDLLVEANNSTNGYLGQVISKTHYLVPTFEEESENIQNKLKDIISEFHIKINQFQSSLAEANEPSSFIDFIYENNHYEINKENITYFLWLKGHSEYNHDLISYSQIKQSRLPNLIKYIDDNINIFTERILLQFKKLDEEEKYFADLLNRIKESKLSDVVQKQKTPLSNLKLVNNRAWDNLLTWNKIIPSWGMIDEYQRGKNDIHDPLLNFLNKESVYHELGSESINISGESINNLQKQIINCNQLSIDSYKTLTSKFSYASSDLDLANLSEEKVLHLLDKRLIMLLPQYYNTLKESFPPLHIKLIETFETLFKNELDQYNLDEPDVSELLVSKDLSSETKQEIIRAQNWSQLTLSKKTSNSLVEIQSLSINLIIKFETLLAVFKISDNTNQKISLIAYHAKNLKHSEIAKLLATMPIPYQLIPGGPGSEKIPNKSRQLRLTKSLKSVGFISSFSEQGDQIKINKKWTNWNFHNDDIIH